METQFDLYLASTSPRRRELLIQIGVRFETILAAVDEAPLPNEPPSDYVRRLSREKAMAGARALSERGLPEKPVLGADTTVVLDQKILGKPADQAKAIAILSLLSGNTHSVLTAVTLVHGGVCESRLSVSTVEFNPLTLEQMEAYWATGEPADKAGAYGIQGLGAVFVKAIHGSYSGVVGLPLAETAELLTLYKVPFWQVAQ